MYVLVKFVVCALLENSALYWECAEACMSVFGAVCIMTARDSYFCTLALMSC